MAGKQINAILSLTDKFSTPLFKVADNTGKASGKIKSQVSQLNRVANRAERRMDNLVKNAFKWGKRMAIAGAGVSLKVGWEGIKELDDGARKVKSITKEALKLNDIKDGLLSLSGKTGIDVSEIAEAQYMAISSSVDPSQSLDYAELATKMSKAGFADPRAAIDLVTSMQNAYGEKGIGQANKMADQFLHTQNRGKIEIAEMTQHYGKLIPLFSQAGVGYDQMNAAMATLTKMGMKPAEASTALAGAIRIMMNPTKKTKDALSELGLEFSASKLEAKGFVGVMDEVMKATGGDMDKITKIFPNARAMLAGASLTGEEGMGEMKAILKELNSGEIKGGLDKAYEVIQNSVGNQWEMLKKNMKNVNTKFYMQYEGNLAEKLKEINEWFENNPDKIESAVKKISDAIGKMIDTLINFAKFVSKHKESIKTIGVALGSLYGALKLFRGLSGLKSVLEVISGGLGVASLSKVGLAILGVAAAITAVYKIYKKVQKIREKFSKSPDNLSGNDVPQFSIDGLDQPMPELTETEESLLRIADAAKRAIGLVGDFIKFLGRVKEVLSSGEWLENNFLNLLLILPTPLKFISGVVVSVKNNFEQLLGGVSKTFDGIVTIIEGITSWDWEKVWEGFKLTLEGIHEFTLGVWGAIVDFITAPVSAVVRLLDNHFQDGIKRVRDAWESLIDFLKHPISGVVNLFTRTVSSNQTPPVRGQGAGSAGQRARNRSSSGATSLSNGIYSRHTGDLSWRGGVVQVSEKGGEILDLPGGTRIYPHDKSVREAYNEGLSVGNSNNSTPPIVVHFNGDLYGDDEYLVNRVGQGIANKIIAELANM